MLTTLMQKYTNLFSYFPTARLATWVAFFESTFFLKLFYSRTELVWQEGLLLDFLQKKSADRFTRRFLGTTGYLISERFFFEWVVRFYIDLIVWPVHKNFIVEFTSVGQTLLALGTLLLTSYLVLTLSYLFVLYF